MNARRVHAVAAGRRGAGVVIGLAVAAVALSAVALLGARARADTLGIFDGAILSTTDGRQIFEQVCQGCHMADARGAVGAGHYPALAKDRDLGSRQYMALTLLAGRRNMPAFGARHAIGFGLPPATLNNEQIAAVINYVRTHFGNSYRDPITAAEVAALDRSLP